MTVDAFVQIRGGARRFGAGCFVGTVMSIIASEI
jgi:hypothetical protein